MNCSDFLIRVESGKLPVAVSVFGDDGYWKKRAVDSIISLCDPFDLNVFDKVEIGELVFALNTIPLLGEKRVVWVKAPPKTTKKTEGKLNEYFKNPNPSSILLLDYEFDGEDVVKVDCNKKSNASAVFSETQRVLASLDRTASEDVVKKLISYCDSNMSNVYSECQKLSAYTDKEITDADIDVCVEPDVNYTSYNLVGYIIKGDYISCYDCFATFPDKFTSILGSLIEAYRCAFYSKSQNINTLQKTLNLSYQALKTAKAVAENYTASGLYALLTLFYDLEFKLKTGRLSSDLAFPLMISEAIERRNKS